MNNQVAETLLSIPLEGDHEVCLGPGNRDSELLSSEETNQKSAKINRPCSVFLVCDSIVNTEHLSNCISSLFLCCGLMCSFEISSESNAQHILQTGVTFDILFLSQGIVLSSWFLPYFEEFYSSPVPIVMLLPPESIPLTKERTEHVVIYDEIQTPYSLFDIFRCIIHFVFNLTTEQMEQKCIHSVTR